MRQLLFAIIALGWCLPSQAGWVAVGAAYDCDVPGGKYVLIATVELGDPPEAEKPGVTTPPSNYVVIGNEETEVRCDLPGADIRTRMRVWPPAAQGMCHGIGVINFSGLTVNSTIEVSNAELFGDGCFDRAVLARIEVTIVQDRSIVLRTCFEDELAGELACTDRRLGSVPANNALERPAKDFQECAAGARNIFAPAALDKRFTRAAQRER